MSKFTLEYPYNQDWKNSYIVTNGENRKNVILYNSHTDRSTTSYARYLYAINIGRYLLSTEHVDHIDDDKTNDVISNLQLLTLKQNSKKEGNRRGRLLVEIECPICKKLFTRRKGQTQLVPSLKNKISCCSKECRTVLSSLNLTIEERNFISKSSIINSYRSHI